MEVKDKEIVLDFARRIGEVIFGEAVTKQGETFWEYEILREEDLAPELIVPLDFYKGTAGIAFFLVQLNKVLKDKKINDLLQHVKLWKSTVPEKDLYKGFFNGFYGNAYMALLKDPEDARVWEFISEDSEEKIEEFDIISGHTGSILCLLMILKDVSVEPNQVELILSKIKKHLQLLMTSLGVFRENVVFKRPDFEVWGGFSHGQQSVEYILRLLSGLFRDDFATNLADSISCFEEKSYDSKIGNYLDLRSRFRHEPGAEKASFEDIKASRQKEQMNMHAWCHGLPGITGSIQMTKSNLSGQTERLERNKTAMHKQLEFFLKDDRKCLCHGTTGNLDYFIDEPGGFDAFMDTIRPHLSEIFHDYETSSYIKGELGRFDCSLMTGLAGIGYFFLRMYDPEQFKSALFPLSLLDMENIKAKYQLKKCFSAEEVGSKNLSELQAELIVQLSKRVVRNIRELKFQSSLDWEVRKDEFHSFFDKDYRFLHNCTLKQNQPLLQNENHLMDFDWIEFQNNVIFDKNSGQLYFYYKNGFHQTEVSEVEILIFEMLEAEKKLSSERLLEFIGEANEMIEFVCQLAGFGFVKVKMSDENE